MAKILQKDIGVQKLHSGGWSLSVMVGDRLHRGRYFDYTLREAKSRFLFDIKAGLV